MKKIFLPLILAFAAACNQQSTETTTEQKPDYESFGEKISPDIAVETGQVTKMLEGKDTARIKLKGTIDEVCQKKGCWMEIAVEAGEPLHVSFKDYGFFVPKDAAGKEMIMEGIAFRDTTSVEELKHLAQDAGKPQEEIYKITQPEIAIVFEASGVLIRKAENTGEVKKEEEPTTGLQRTQRESRT